MNIARKKRGITGGRPLKFTTAEEVRPSIEDYFAYTPQNEWTITGLALAAGFNTRQGLLEYADRAEFGDVIKDARLLVEHSYEMSLRARGSAGDIFGLKNFNWRDKTETESTVIADVTTNGQPINTEVAAGYAAFMEAQTKPSQ